MPKFSIDGLIFELDKPLKIMMRFILTESIQIDQAWLIQ